MVDLPAAVAFCATHARLVERRRLAFHLGATDPAPVMTALLAYRNADGGFGWALEPDLRSATSQPVGALTALETLEELAPAGGDVAAAVCDWLASVTLPGGGLPFGLHGAADPGSAPWWAASDPEQPSLHLTAAIATAAVRLAARHPEVADHPWLAGVVEWCLERIGEAAGHTGYELMYVVRFLDAVAPGDERAMAHLERLATTLPADWTLPVAGGQDDERLRPLQISPRPGTPLRSLAPPGVIDADLDRVAAGQQPDGGWTVDFASATALAAIEWRGIATVDALLTLVTNGRLDPAG